MNTGWQQRLSILRREAEIKFISILQTHDWESKIEQEVENGEYLIISAARGGHKHLIAFIYTSATDRRVYKSLEDKVEHVFFNGAPYNLESFTNGIKIPVKQSNDFHELLLIWNKSSSIGKFAPSKNEDISVNQNTQNNKLILLSEEPIEAIWLRIRQLQSITLAKKLVLKRAEQKNIILDNNEVCSKAEGISYALRNAFDNFQAGKTHNLTQRILNIYYGCLSFAFVEMLASPQGAKMLSEIECSTKQGHGLYTIDGLNDGIEKIVVGIILSGFFSKWTKFMGLFKNNIPEKKPKEYSDLEKMPKDSWITIEQLFASIPEISDLYNDIFDSAPRYVTIAYDSKGNLSSSNKSYKKTYILFIDKTNKLKKEDIAKFPGQISEISVASEYSHSCFRAAIDHENKNSWWEALNIHRSPFVEDSMILPIFNEVSEYRSICVTLLYALSIIVRYRPSIWRRVQEGDLDHMRVLIEAFLAVVERILPEEFLNKITGCSVLVKQPGSFF